MTRALLAVGCLCLMACPPPGPQPIDVKKATARDLDGFWFNAEEGTVLQFGPADAWAVPDKQDVFVIYAGKPQQAGTYSVDAGVITFQPTFDTFGNLNPTETTLTSLTPKVELKTGSGRTFTWHERCDFGVDGAGGRGAFADFQPNRFASGLFFDFDADGYLHTVSPNSGYSTNRGRCGLVSLSTNPPYGPMRIDASGTIHVVAIKDGELSYATNRVIERETAVVPFVRERIDAALSDLPIDFKLAPDGTPTAVVSFEEPRLYRRVNGVWQVRPIPALAWTGLAHQTRLAFAPDGTVKVAGARNGELIIATETATGWTTVTTPHRAYDGNAAFAITPDGVEHLVFPDQFGPDSPPYANGRVEWLRLMHATHGASGWAVESLVTGWYPELEVGSDGALRLAWFWDRQGFPTPLYARLDGDAVRLVRGGKQPEANLGSPLMGSVAQLRVGRDGRSAVGGVPESVRVWFDPSASGEWPVGTQLVPAVVAKTGDGAGRVVAAGIDCGSTCSTEVPVTTLLPLKLEPDSESFNAPNRCVSSWRKDTCFAFVSGADAGLTFEFKYAPLRNITVVGDAAAGAEQLLFAVGSGDGLVGWGELLGANAPPQGTRALYRFSATGQVSWVRSFPSFQVQALVAAPSGRLYAAGTKSPGAFDVGLGPLPGNPSSALVVVEFDPATGSPLRQAARANVGLVGFTALGDGALAVVYPGGLGWNGEALGQSHVLTQLTPDLMADWSIGIAGENAMSVVASGDQTVVVRRTSSAVQAFSTSGVATWSQTFNGTTTRVVGDPSANGPVHLSINPAGGGTLMAGSFAISGPAWVRLGGDGSVQAAGPAQGGSVVAAHRRSGGDFLFVTSVANGAIGFEVWDGVTNVSRWSFGGPFTTMTGRVTPVAAVPRGDTVQLVFHLQGQVDLGQRSFDVRAQWVGFGTFAAR